MTTFSSELRRAMTRRGIGTKALARDTGITATTISAWRSGRWSPRADKAALLAEALGWPGLSAALLAERTAACRLCDRSFLVTGWGGGGRQRYCSRTCQNRDKTRRMRASQRDYQAQTIVRLEGEVGGYREALLAYCLDCTGGEGVCRDGDCAWRSRSQLPFIPLNAVRRAA